MSEHTEHKHELTREEFNILTDIYQQHLFDRIRELRRMDRRWEGLQTINDLKEVNDHYKTVRVPLLDKLHRLSAKAP